MLKRLHLRNFTVFADAEFEFGEGLNVLVGTNGTGKTHVLKAGYAISYEVMNSIIKSREQEDNNIDDKKRKSKFMFDKLKKVFQPTPFQLNELIRHKKYEHKIRFDLEKPLTHIDFRIRCFGGLFVDTSFSFTPTSSIAPVYILPHEFDRINGFVPPVFIPAKEALTMGWLPALYGRFDIPFDETYPDLLRLLSGPSLRQPEPIHIVEKLAQLIGGKVEEEGGHFYLAAPDQPRLEMNLVAEGMRKFATLYKLLANGTLTSETTLFWDEPEANLNPALLKELAAVLTDLAQAGFQIILATHSLFLMRELHILAQQKKKPVHYFGLYASEEGDVRVERQDDLMQLQHITALDAELAQTFDFEAALDQDYAGDS
ncbi:MAG: AAA family ATPase [Janthinobacterium lividum]